MVPCESGINTATAAIDGCDEPEIEFIIGTECFRVQRPGQKMQELVKKAHTRSIQ
jgi:hypothetical protein